MVLRKKNNPKPFIHETPIRVFTRVAFVPALSIMEKCVLGRSRGKGSAWARQYGLVQQTMEKTAIHLFQRLVL